VRYGKFGCTFGQKFYDGEFPVVNLQEFLGRFCLLGKFERIYSMLLTITTKEDIHIVGNYIKYSQVL